MEAAAGYAITKSASALSSGLQGRNDALARSAEARNQAYLADTQAIQRDTLSRDELQRTLSGIRAARAANGLSSTSPNARILERDAITNADRDRLVQVGDYRVKASSLRQTASQYRSLGRMSLLTGAVSATVPLAQYRLNQE